MYSDIGRCCGEYYIRYKTPYMDCEVFIGETYKSELKRDGFLINEVSYGIHSFENYADCDNKLFDYDSVVAKCIIPKSSLYYKGQFNGCSSYVSNKLTYLKIV